MKINLKELFEERWNSGWSFDEATNSFTDEMVDAAVSSGKPEFAVILAPGLLKRVKCECKFPCLRDYFVTGIFDLWLLDSFRKKLNFPPGTLKYSLITFSKDKPAKIRICAAPEDLTNKKVKWTERVETCKEYYKDLESYINASKKDKIPDNLKSLVRNIDYADYREEIFDVRYYSERFIKISNTISNAMKKQKFVPLTDLVEIIEPGNFPLKKDDILISEDGGVGLIPEDSKTVHTAGFAAVLRLKSTMVTPEYLFLYLNSGIFRDINYLLKVELAQDIFILTDWNDLSKIGVFVPAASIPMALDPIQSQKYRDMFNQKYRHNLVTEKDNEVDDAPNDVILQEEMKGENLVSDPDANERIVDLLRELNGCVSHGIYIGAGILIGSVLEAFFTGWVGDMDNEDYFRDPVSYEYFHGKERALDLSFRDAIDKVLLLLKKGKVDKETLQTIRQKVEAIRSMRDDVHARVYLKHQNKMTKSVCETALKDLEDIIKLRYRNFQMDSFMKKNAME